MIFAHFNFVAFSIQVETLKEKYASLISELNYLVQDRIKWQSFVLVCWTHV